MKKEDVKYFWEEHKEQIIMGALAVTGFALGWHFCKNHYKLHKASAKVVETASKLSDELPLKGTHQFVDEDIFTNIAPQIEEAVLTEGLDEAFIEATYHVAWPKGGDFKNGVYEELKKVTVKVMDITEP